MPPLSFDEASLDEILEVRGQPLTEKELWAVLLEGAKTLKSVLVKGLWLCSMFWFCLLL